MLTRKQFLKRSALAAAGLSFIGCIKPDSTGELAEKFEKIHQLPLQTAVRDEPLWQALREQFDTSGGIINLNNGGVSPQPLIVQEKHIGNYKFCNDTPSYNMWRELDKQREPLRARLAEMAGCSPEEIAINRNTTEGLNTIIFGLNLKAGDEVVLCKYDYPHMINAWRQREKRDGIKLNWVDLNFPEEDEEAIVGKYVSAITARTKIVHVTHMINWTGQLLPVQKITAIAQQKGCEVVVDGAHTFAHIDFKISELGCDYYATSLHKWLCAPFGTGMMYIRKEKIPQVWALLSATEPDGTDIRKFESLGTRSFAAEMAINEALEFHHSIGSKQKEERLRYLKNYWAEKVQHLPKLKLHTSLKPEFSCGIACFTIEGHEPVEMVNYLFEKKKIHTSNVNLEQVRGVRVSPHIYTTLQELDLLVEGIKEMV